MTNPIGAVSAPTATQYAVEVTGKAHEQASVEGKQAVQLIESATAPQLETAGDVGTTLNFKA
ncbi:MAG: hypothetical protein ABIQ16_02375 [Polyangiaceae bacterium]